MNLRFSFIIVPMLLLSGCELFSPEEPLLDVRSAISTLRYIDTDPSWSPDGETIVFMHYYSPLYKDTLASGLYAIQPDGSNKTLIEEGVFRGIDWSPDGTHIAYSRGGDIYIRSMTDGDTKMVANVGNDHSPRWNTSGTHLSFTQSICQESKQCGTWVKAVFENTLFFVAEFGSDADWIDDNIIYYTRSQISSDGVHTGTEIWSVDISRLDNQQESAVKTEIRHLSYSIQNQKFLVTALDPVRLATLEMDGEVSSYLSEEGYVQQDGTWSPDGQQIVYTNPSSDNGYLWIMNKDGSGKRQLTFPN